MKKLWHRWRSRPWWIRYAACALVLIPGFYALENLRGHLAWENYRAAAEARGERFEIEELLPPISPDSDNFEASAFFRKLNGAEPFELINFDNLPGVDPSISAARKAGYVGQPLCQPFPLKALFSEDGEGMTRRLAAERLLEQLARWEEGLDECAEAVRRRGWAPLTQEQEVIQLYADNLSYMDALETARVLQVRSRARLEMDSPDGALQDLMTLLHLSRQLMQGGRSIGVDVGTVVISETEHVIWEGLRDRHWNRRELKELLSGLEALGVNKGMALAMRIDRARGLEVLGLLTNGPVGRFEVNEDWGFIFSAREFAEIHLPAAFAEPAGKIDSLFLALIPGGWAKLNMRRLCRLDELQLAALGEADPHRRAEIRRDFDVEFAKFWWPRDGLIEHLVLERGDFEESHWQYECRLSMARIAVALEMYRIDHGQYPAALAQLAPDYLTFIPNDPFSGGPLRYELKLDGTPRIWSFGRNLQDDGGDVHKDEKQGDLVWQYTIPEYFTIEDYRD